jgi:hypothetical protein
LAESIFDRQQVLVIAQHLLFGALSRLEIGVQQIKAVQMLLAPDQFIVFLILKLAAKYEVKLKKWGGSQVRGLPLKEAKILSEEHKAVLLVVIGHRRKKGVSKARVGEILGLDASSRENPRVLSQGSLVFSIWSKTVSRFMEDPFFGQLSSMRNLGRR